MHLLRGLKNAARDLRAAKKLLVMARLMKPAGGDCYAVRLGNAGGVCHAIRSDFAGDGDDGNTGCDRIDSGYGILSIGCRRNCNSAGG